MKQEIEVPNYTHEQGVGRDGFHFHYEVALDHLEANSMELVIERDDWQDVD